MNSSIASPDTKKSTGSLRKKVNKPINQIAQRILLICGILSSAYYVAMNIFIPMKYPGYSTFSQTVSELSAIGTPTRQLWVSLMIVYTVLVIAFGWGVWLSVNKYNRLRVVAVVMIINVIIGLFWPPMHQREVLAAGEGTLTDILHIVWTAITIPLMFLAIGLGAAAFGKGFRIYSIVTIVAILLFGVLTGLASSRMELNLSTPFMGVWERICIGAYMLWVMMLAIILLLSKRQRGSIKSKILNEVCKSKPKFVLETDLHRLFI